MFDYRTKKVNKMRVFSPLKEDHPLVQDQSCCWICRRVFSEGERVVLLATQTSEESGSLTVRAEPVHATCALRGKEVKGYGIISRIKDGDGSPFPVELTNGRQFRLEELGLE